MMGIGERWWRQWRERQADLRARAALLDRAARGDPAGEQAWEQIFDRPKVKLATYAHRGRCRRCNAKVIAHSRRCERCGAVWIEFKDRRGHLASRHFYGFCLLSLLLALAGGVVLKTLTGWWLRGHAFNEDFVEFVESYLWVAATILLLVAATYVYERLDIAARGEWRDAKSLDKSGPMRHS